MENLINLLFNSGKFKLLKTKFSNSTNKFVKNIYDDINNIKLPSYKINKDKFNMYGEHFNIIPAKFKNYINSKSLYTTSINTKIDKRIVNIHMMHPNNYYTHNIELLIRWLTYAYSISPIQCSKQLNVFIYLTPFNKELPNIELINTSHANNAFTFACLEENEINIFRHEEWFKVFIHETIHALGIDFSRFNYSRTVNPILNKVFRLNIDYNVHEAYCETLATFFNVILLNHHLPFNKFLNNIQDLMFNEAQFSLYQSAKILNHHNILYQKVIRAREPSIYNETTPIFSYFIIKACLLYNLDKFFISRNKKSIVFKKDHLPNFISFIQKHAVSRNFIYDLNKVQELIYNYKHKQSKSLRFSLYG
jgi:hypothetical protein